MVSNDGCFQLISRQLLLDKVDSEWGIRWLFAFHAPLQSVISRTPFFCVRNYSLIVANLVDLKGHIQVRYKIKLMGTREAKLYQAYFSVKQVESVKLYLLLPQHI